MRRCLGRGGWLVVWRGEMSGRLSCAPFLSARVRRRCRWFLVFRSPRLASRLFCSFRRGGRCVACLASVGRGGCGCDVVSSRFLVPCSRPVCVFLIGVPCRLVCFSSLSSLYSDSSRRACRVAACLASFGRRRCGGAWLLDVGCAAWRGGVACRGLCRWRFGDAVSCGGACRERDEGRDVWRDEGRDDERAVFVSSSWRFVGRWRRCGWMRAGGVPWAWWCHPHVSSFFFLASRIG